jgi:putative redox protein
MVDAIVKWQKRLTFKGSANSGFEVNLGAGKEVGGDDDGFRPMEMIAMGLAGCSAMDVISILQKKRQEISGFEVNVHTEQEQKHPKVFTSATIEYIVSGYQIQEQAVARAIELSATRYCPAQAMFANVFPIALKYQIYEDQANDDRKLVMSGELNLSE